jgi:hypothetical protein
MWFYCAVRREKELGFAGQGRAVVFHHLRNGDSHMHVVWSRIDPANMRAIDPGLYKNRLKEICRELERELHLTRVSSVRAPYDEEEKSPVTRNEFEQARRLQTRLEDVRASIRECWNRSDNGYSFAAALEEKELALARGDRRDFVIVDYRGGIHALGKRITGAAMQQRHLSMKPKAIIKRRIKAHNRWLRARAMKVQQDT